MNLLPGRIAREDDSAVVKLPGVVSLPLALGPAADMAVTAGIRPEHFEWAEPGQAAAIEAPAAVVEPLGSDTLVGIALGEHSLQVRLPPRRVRRAGELVRLNVAREQVHLFDREGRRIAS